MQGFEWYVHEKLYLHWISCTFFYCIRDRNYVVDSNNKKETLHEQKRNIFQMVHLTKRLFVIQLLLLSLFAHFTVHRNSFYFLDSHWHFHSKHKCCCSQALIDIRVKNNIPIYLCRYMFFSSKWLQFTMVNLCWEKKSFSILPLPRRKKKSLFYQKND